MKRFVISALVGIALSVASYGVYETQSRDNTLSDIMLANVEALSGNETAITPQSYPAFKGEKHYTGALKYMKDENGKCVMTFLNNIKKNGDCVMN